MDINSFFFFDTWFSNILLDSICCLFILSFFIFFNNYFFLAVLGLCCFLGFSLALGSGVCSLAVCRLLIAVASLFVEHGLWGRWASVVGSSQDLEHRFSSCGVWR